MKLEDDTFINISGSQ